MLQHHSLFLGALINFHLVTRGFLLLKVMNTLSVMFCHYSGSMEIDSSEITMVRQRLHFLHLFILRSLIRYFRHTICSAAS